MNDELPHGIRTTGNGLPRRPRDPASNVSTQLYILGQRVINILSRRMDIEGVQPDRRRDIEKECGYPDLGNPVPVEQCRNLFEREEIANRVVSIWPRECWQVSPSVYEEESTDVTTPFEEDWNRVASTLRGKTNYVGGDEEGSPIWEYLSRADVLSGIGRFGIVLLGLDDGLPFSHPVRGYPLPPSKSDRPITSPLSPGYPGTTPPSPTSDQETSTYWQPTLSPQTAYLPTVTPDATAPTSPGEKKYEDERGVPDRATYREDSPETVEEDERPDEPLDSETSAPTEPQLNLVYLRVFPEYLVQVTRYETDLTSPRFGQPVMYLVTLNDPRTQGTGIGLSHQTLYVHWTRVIHVADVHHMACSSETFAYPRMEPVINRLLDIRKISAGSGEMYWQGAFPPMSLETLPQLGGDVDVDEDKLKDAIEEMFNGLQRYIITKGMTLKAIAPVVVDPTPHVEAKIKSVCIQIGIPMRVFMGSERGELASAQDDAAWNDRVRQRQIGYLTPRLVLPFIQRLIDCHVLRAPTKGFCVYWPDITSKSDDERANIALKITQALSAYVSGGVENVLPLSTFMSKYLHWTDEEVRSVVEDLQSAQVPEGQPDDMGRISEGIQRKAVASVTPSPTPNPPNA